VSQAAARCDLHLHSVASTDSGNYALRKARLGESYTAPERVHATCLRRGMSLVTISDHNTLEGVLRIADRPGVFLSEEVTACFAEDDLPLHVLVWNLTEEDHLDLQPWRPSVVDLVGFLRERGLAHALAHPLYRMGPPLTPAHVERLLLLFGVWEGRNGARPRESNELACRIAAAATPAYLAKLAERHGIAPAHERIALTGGSDDHGALDIATTWTEGPGATPAEFLRAVCNGEGAPRGEHGSATKLAHAVGALLLNAYRRHGGSPPEPLAAGLERLFDEDADDATLRHAEIETAVSFASRRLAERARTGALALASLPTLGSRLGTLLLAGALEAPYLASLRLWVPETRVPAVSVASG
jgi:predicted metal-dependent phosphoesterase TrpH